jgi:hypothetical protein
MLFCLRYYDVMLCCYVMLLRIYIVFDRLTNRDGSSCGGNVVVIRNEAVFKTCFQSMFSKLMLFSKDSNMKLVWDSDVKSNILWKCGFVLAEVKTVKNGVLFVTGSS